MSERPKRIQRCRTKGWRMPEGAVYVGRPTRWGNPWFVDNVCRTWVRIGDADLWLPQRITVADTVGYFRLWLRGDDMTNILRVPIMFKELAHRRLSVLAAIGELRGRDLACWCPLSSPCHADVLLEIANQDSSHE